MKLATNWPVESGVELWIDRIVGICEQTKMPRVTTRALGLTTEEMDELCDMIRARGFDCDHVDGSVIEINTLKKEKLST